MTCGACAKTIADDSDYCKYCGAPARPPVVEERVAEPPPPASADDERPCPFCAERIKRQARKCRFCGEWLDGASPGPNRPKASAPVLIERTSKDLKGRQLFWGFLLIVGVLFVVVGHRNGVPALTALGYVIGIPSLIGSLAAAMASWWRHG